MPPAVVPSPRIPAASDGKRLADQAADLARAAAQRHARHIRSLRASRENPSAFAGLYDPTTALVETDTLDPAALALSAASRMADHIRQRRLAAAVPSAFADRARSVSRPEESIPERGAIGHNSRGIDVDAAEEPVAIAAPAGGRIDIEALVKRATSIHSQHVAMRRKRLTTITLRPGQLSGGGSDSQ
jgi:hypothetical protein